MITPSASDRRVILEMHLLCALAAASERLSSMSRGCLAEVVLRLAVALVIFFGIHTLDGCLIPSSRLDSQQA